MAHRTSKLKEWVRARQAGLIPDAGRPRRSRFHQSTEPLKDERGYPYKPRNPLQEKWERILAAYGLGLQRARLISGGFDEALLDHLAHNVTERRRNEREYYLHRYKNR